jgi:hypothetical protein
LDVIPDTDRTPLRVRRRVVEKHAPAVIEQLEVGRFVAAAWVSGDGLSLILCHPNLAKMGPDALLVNPSSLPRLVVKLATWEEAPTAVGLFLRAFGSEAATPRECADARRDLAAWLASQSQPEMAAVTRHYSAFPFGVKSDALEVINIWRKVLVKGEKDAIDRFLGEAQRRFEELGWSRDTGTEAKLNNAEHQLNRFYCWVSGQETTRQVMLCLNRSTDRRVRGATYEVLDHRVGLADVAKAIQQALGEVLEPAADTVGVMLTYPHLGPISRVGTKTAGAMTAFAEAGDGKWPLPEDVEPIWRHFVVTAFRDDAAFNPDELRAWFVASGWDDQAAQALAKRFYAEAALLGEFEERGQPAWQ